MKKKIFILTFLLGLSLEITNGQIVEGGMALLNLSGSKGILSGITSKLSNFLGGSSSQKIDPNLILKLQRIEKLMENSLCLMNEFSFQANYYLNSNSCLYNIHKEGTLINYNYSLSALSTGVGALGSAISGIISSATGGSSSSSVSNNEDKLDKIITQAEEAIAQLEDMCSRMQTDIYSSIYKTYEIKSVTGYGANYSKRMKNVF